jgi:sulfur carrier protein ThiS
VKFRIQFRGAFPAALTRRELEVDAPQELTLADVVGLIGHEVPELVGSVIRPDANSLRSPYAFMVNGRLYLDEYDRVVGTGDRIVVLTIPFGG